MPGSTGTTTCRRTSCVLAAVALLSLPTLSGAQSPVAETEDYALPTSGTVLEDTRSEAYREVDREAMVLWRAGRRTEAAEIFTRALARATQADAAAARLRLAYHAHLLGDKAGAKERFAAVAAIPAGVNDKARGEAAVRMAFSETSHTRTRLCLEILAGKYRVGHREACEVATLLGGTLHRSGDLPGSIRAFSSVARQAADTTAGASARCELAGLWFERAKGEGVSALPREERASAFQRAREYCAEVILDKEHLSEERRMVASLMFFESFYFQKQYEGSLNAGQAFFTAWGDDPAEYRDPLCRKYVYTALTFQMINAYALGDMRLAARLSKKVGDHPPAPEEQFTDCTTTATAAVVAMLAEEGLGAAPDRVLELRRAGEACDCRTFRQVEKQLRLKRRSVELALPVRD